MSNHPPRSHRASFNSQRRQQQLSILDDPASLALSRTRSNDLSVGETVVAHEPAQHELQKTIDEDDTDSDEPTKKWPRSVKYLILLCAFIASTSFGVTQVPIVYIFRLMCCDVYYEQHSNSTLASSTLSSQTTSVGAMLSYALSPSTPLIAFPNSVNNDRCAVREIDSTTALNIALMGGSTTIFGTINLFWTGNLIKRIGLKSTLLLNVAVPALRLLVQNIGAEVGGRAGLTIMQCSQMMTVMGGPVGYMLVLNSFMTEVVDYDERTGALGMVAGSMMFGSALGYLIGGQVAEIYNIKIPFRMTLVLFVCTAIYVAVCLPYVPPPQPDVANDSVDDKPKPHPIKKFIEPLFVFTPKKYIRRDGAIYKEYGTFLLACGVFLSVLATGYLATLLQLYSTNVFSFGTSQNGWLIFMYSLLRGIFLTFAFPQIIRLGRKLTAKPKGNSFDAKDAEQLGTSERDPLLETSASNSHSTAHKAPQKEQTYVFDLFYTRFSILFDGILTLGCTLAHKGWHMYVVAAVLPLAAGTGSAAKGTVLQMVGSSASSSERVDALAGLSLVENIARLSTTFVFGVVFAAFASIGREDLSFTVNAGIAILGFFVLLFARFPPKDSQRLDYMEADATGT